MSIGYRDAVTRERWMADEIDPEEEYLCVTYRDEGYRIYNTLTGKPFIKKIKFSDKNLALKFGKFLHKCYGEYLWILKDPDWADKNILELVQYTIPNGVEILAAIEEMRKHETVNSLDLISRFI